MASPFKFFRQHQAGMMVVLVILAMLVFTLDALFTGQGANFWLLGLLVGGTVCGVAGIGSGRWLHWAIIGGFLGTVMGLMVPEFNKPDGVIATTFGIVEQEELQDLSERRAVANGFMQLASEAAFGPGGRQFAFQFGFGHPSQREDLLFGRLMHEEAKALGIAVTDEMISDFVNKCTGDKLSGESFGISRRALSYKQAPVHSEALFEILREQLRDRLAYMALLPTGSVSPPAPGVYWEYFQRMNVRQSIHVTELDLDAFTDQIADPTDDQIQDLFDSAVHKRPNQDEPGSPGFALPGRARIAWLEQDYDSIESLVPPVTDEEVETFYNENRDARYRTIVVPEKADTTPSADSTPGEPAPVDVTPESEPDPGSDPESSDKPPPAGDGPGDSAIEKSAPESTDEETEEPESTVSEPTVEESPSEGTDDGGQFSVDDPEAVAETPATQDLADTEGPVALEASAATDEGTDISPDPLFPVQLRIPEESETESGEENPLMAPEYEYRELDDDLRESIRDELLQQRVRKAIAEKMQAGWDFLRSIQSELRKRRTSFMKQDPQKHLDDPDAAALDLRREMANFTPELLERMKNYANDNNFIYVVTNLVSFQDFSDRDDYPLGLAVDPSLPPFQVQGATEAVAFKVFSGFGTDVAANDTQLFVPERAVLEPLAEDGTESHYVYWTVEFEEPHVPKTLKEHGVREQVKLAFKRAKARKPLTQRAEQLAQKVRDGLEKADEERISMAETLKSESITGEEASATLTVRLSQPFSWLRQSQAPPTSFQSRGPRAELSTIRFADGASTLTGIGQEFMRTIFEELGDDEVGIVPNYDRTRYFLVHVTNRFPTLDNGIDGLQSRFAMEGRMNFLTSPVTELMSGEIVNPVVIEWKRATWRKYGAGPDADPGES